MEASQIGAARHGSVRLVGVSLLLLVLACASEPAGPGAPHTDGDPSDQGGVPVGPDGADPVHNVLAAAPSEQTRRMAQTFETLCSACHGDWGEGSSAPSLWRLTDRDALVRTIGTRMPPKDPSLCAGECAEQMADFILSEFGEEALSCDGIRPAPRQLRLLNRREYANTVRTLFGAVLGAPTPTCGSYSFRFDPGREVSSVHVAGTFNGWSDSAWPMAFDTAARTWVLDKELADGSYEFKYVVRDANGVAWQADAVLPQSGSYGNSMLTMSCAGAGGTLDLSSLPSETRPAAFAFDTTVASVVGTQQFEAYFATAKQVASALVDPLALADCDLTLDRTGCGRQFLARFGKRVFRRPLRDAEIERYLALLVSGGDVELALRTTLSALLASPGFLYRSELGVRQADGSYLLTPHEVASALSYLLAGDMPDAVLLAAADVGALQSETEIHEQARRLLSEAASHGALSDFVLQWLGVSSVAALERPDASPSLLAAMRDETARFAEHVLFDSAGTLAELLSADYSFVNDELAALYGMPALGSGDFRNTAYTDDLRSGVLGHASVLATYAHENQTSPVLRGLFVRRQLLCQRFGEPPPNAGTVPELDPALSTRQRFDVHSTDACASCHQHIDGLGFGFEHFDTLGRYRETEGVHPVDARGDLSGVARLSDGGHQPFSSPRELAPLLLESPAAHDCVAKQAYRFTRGALDGGLSYCAVKLVRQRYRESQGRVLEALLAAVQAVDFRYRY